MEKKLAGRLVCRYKTNDPFAIIDHVGIFLVCENLGKSTWGYYTNVSRVPVIHINETKMAFEQRYAAAHELGHHFLHKCISTPFLRANTLLSVDKIERQANQFAVELLIPDRLLIEGSTIYEAAKLCGVPRDVAHLKQPPTNYRYIS